jgi:rhodanese-related sulfurtransferase
MRKLIFTALLALLSTAVGYTQQGDAPKQAAGAKKGPASKAKVLTRGGLDSLLASPEKVLLIDVRRPDEISSNGGFPVYLSIQAGELEKHLAEIPRDRVIVTVSNHAARGGRAADLLADHGFNVAGTVGAETYESEGGKLIRIAIPPPRNDEKK